MIATFFDERVWTDAVAGVTENALPVASRDECDAIATRVLAMAAAAGTTVSVEVRSESIGSLRWARNRPLASTDSTDLTVTITIRLANEAEGRATTNRTDDASLRDAVSKARQLAQVSTKDYPEYLPPGQTYAQIQLLSDPALRMDMPARSALARPMAVHCRDLSMLSAGFLSITARAVFVKNDIGLTAYSPSTRCDYSITVRDLAGSASGWAGQSHHDWTKIDVAAINDRALQKCVDSAHPVAVEPGRYTTILEPEAVAQLMWFAIAATYRPIAESGEPPYGKPPEGPSKIGLRMLDPRISVVSDPADPDAGYTPFAWDGERYRKIVWFDKGILRSLYYGREEAKQYGDTEGLLPPWPLAFTMTGGDTTIADMVKSTQRGILVTHFTEPVLIDGASLSVTANTRDGLWLVENGKISKAIKNFRFNDSPLFSFNNVEQLGPPVRAYGTSHDRGESAIVAPPAKVLDFNFTSLSDAV